MKTRAVLLIVLCLLMSTGACAQTMYPIAPDVQMDALESLSIMCTVDAFNADEKTIDVTLYVPELFEEKALAALQPGDVVVSDGVPCTIENLQYDNGYSISINGGEDSYSGVGLYFYCDSDGYAQQIDYDAGIYTKLGSETLQLPEHFLFLDGVRPDTGEPLDRPAVHSLAEFMTLMAKEKAEDGIGLASQNAYIVFDGSGIPALLCRYYVSWQ